MIGFEDVFFSSAAPGSVWKGYNGAQDGAAASVLSSLSRWDGVHAPNFLATMLTDTLGLAIGSQDNSGGAGGDWVPKISLRGFTVSGTSVSPGAAYTYNPPSSVFFGRLRLFRLNANQALLTSAYSAGTGDVRCQGHLVTVDDTGAITSVSAPVQANATYTDGIGYIPLADNKILVVGMLTPTLWTVSGGSLSVAYPFGFAPWAPYGPLSYSKFLSQGRIDNSRFWLDSREGGVSTRRSYLLSGATASLVNAAAMSGDTNTVDVAMSADKMLARRWNGMSYQYYRVNIGASYEFNEVAYAATNDSGALYFSPDGRVVLCGKDSTSTTLKLATLDDASGDIVVSAPVVMESGTTPLLSVGLEPFPTSKNKALLAYYDGAANVGWVKVIHA